LTHTKKEKNKDTLGNWATRHVMKTTFAQYSRLPAKKHDSKLPPDYCRNAIVIAILKRNENSVEVSSILG
jgi:hypothetical protein